MADIFKSLMELGNKRSDAASVGANLVGMTEERSRKTTWVISMHRIRFELTTTELVIWRDRLAQRMKQFLANQIPVVIGSQVCSDFAGGQFVGAIDSDGVYSYSNDGL